VVDDKAAEPVPADGMTPACRHVVLRAVARVSPLSALARTSSVHQSWTARGRAHGPLARPLHFARVHEKPKPSAAARIAGAVCHGRRTAMLASTTHGGFGSVWTRCCRHVGRRDDLPADELIFCW